MASQLTPEVLKRTGSRMKTEDGQAVLAKIQELSEMADKAQNGIIQIAQKPRAVSKALRDANFKLVRLEHDVKGDPKASRVLEKLQLASEAQRHAKKKEADTHVMMLNTAEELRTMRDQLKALELEAELADAVKDKMLRSSQAKELNIFHTKAMNAQEEAAKAHYTLDSLLHTKIMIQQAHESGNDALRVALKHLQKSLAISTRARAANKEAGMDAKAILSQAKVVRMQANKRNKALVEQLEKRVAERNVAPFVSLEKGEAEQGAKDMELDGDDFRKKYGTYMPGQ
jgi:hypothetical protein